MSTTRAGPCPGDLALRDQAIHPFQIVDHSPGATSLVYAFFPEIEALLVIARVDVVAPQLGDVERDYVDFRQRDREIADMTFLQVFFKVRKYQYGKYTREIIFAVLYDLRDLSTGG